MRDKESQMKLRVAKELCKMNDAGKRKWMVIKNALLLVIFMYGLTESYQWDSDLNIMPQTFCALLCGHLMVSTTGVLRFPLVGRYIDWGAVRRDAGEDDVAGEK